MANVAKKGKKAPTTTFVKVNRKGAEVKVTLSSNETEYTVKLDYMRMNPKNEGSNMAFNKKPPLRIRRFKALKAEAPRFEFEWKDDWHPFDSMTQESLDDMYNPVERYEGQIKRKSRQRQYIIAFGFLMFFIIGGYVIVELGFEPRVLAGAMSVITVGILLTKEYWDDYVKGKFPIEDHTITKVGDERQKNFEEVILFYVMEAFVARLGISDQGHFALGGEMVYRQHAGFGRVGWSDDCKVELFALFTFDGTCTDAILHLQKILEKHTQSDGVTFSHIVTGYTTVDRQDLDMNELTLYAKANDETIEVPVVIRYGFPMTPAPTLSNYKPLLCPPVDVSCVAPEMMLAMKLVRLGDVHTPAKEAKVLAEDLKRVLFRKTYPKKRLQLGLRMVMALHGLALRDVQAFLKKKYLLIHDKVFDK